VHPSYLEQCRQPGADNAAWLTRQKSYFKGVAPDIHQALMLRAQEIGPDVELNDLLSCDRFDMMEDVQDIRLPTTIICGGDDRMTPVKYADYLSDRIKGSRREIIPDAEHFVQLQQYQQVNTKIEEFLGRLR
jgi:pimeloyl-ACP methyl ester carboxylesterase